MRRLVILSGAFALVASFYGCDTQTPTEPPGAAAMLTSTAQVTEQTTTLMETVYGSLRLWQLRAVPTDGVLNATWHMVNRTRNLLQIPLNTDYSEPFYLVGVRQFWIERLGPDNTIPSVPPRIFRDADGRYAAGFTIIIEDAEWPAREARSYSYAFSPAIFDLAEFPKGSYRLTLEYRTLLADGNEVIQSVGRHFAVP